MLVLPGGKGVYNQTLLVQRRMWQDLEPRLVSFSYCSYCELNFRCVPEPRYGFNRKKLPHLRDLVRF